MGQHLHPRWPFCRSHCWSTRDQPGATFDTELVEAMSNATADEMRANSVRTMQQSRGQGPINSLSCDGGPLANSAHDPRWGRISETYGEDPFLITRMAVTANRAMQQPVQDANGRTFLKTSQTTRHYMGYHQSNQMHIPESMLSSVTSETSSCLHMKRCKSMGSHGMGCLVV